MNHFRAPARPATVKSGGRELAGRLAPTWLGVPFRRGLQSLFLLLFLFLFFVVSWPYPKAFTHEALAVRATQPVELLLWLDPLVGLSTAVATRAWNVALWGMVVILGVSLFLPRTFCGYLCPLGTLIDLFDWAVSRRIVRKSKPPPTRWTNLRFIILAAILGAAMGGVLLSGFLAAIPVLTRGLVFTAGNLQLGLLKNWGMVPELPPALWFSVALFAGVFLLGLKTPRFWCRYLCPTGALLSLPGLVKLSRREVDFDRCIACGQCIETCPFEAIEDDHTTRWQNCSFCQTCAGACPTEAIRFVGGHDPKTGFEMASPSVSRRAAMGAVLGGLATAVGGRALASPATLPVRPPGSVAEDQFLDLCIRCEQCLKVCPGPVLQAAGLEHGWEALWTPVAVFSHAGCHQECHFCTQVCPTGAIRPLDLEEKRRARMGLAVIDPQTCLPLAGKQDCQLCFDECEAAGYHAIEMRLIKLALGDIREGAFSPDEIEAMGQIKAPFVLPDACVGCGLCEYRCHAVNHRQKKLLTASAVVVRSAGRPGVQEGNSQP